MDRLSLTAKLARLHSARISAVGSIAVHVHMRFLAALLFATLWPAAAPINAQNHAPEWIRQFGTSGHDSGGALAADRAGGVYMTASASLTRYDAAGNLLWISTQGASSSAIALDSQGGIYSTGGFEGDAYLARFDSSGSLNWARRITTPQQYDASSAVAANDGGAYIADTAGVADDPQPEFYLRRFDSSGNRLWSRQRPVGLETARSMAAVNNAVYVGTGATLSRYDDAGNLVWTYDLGPGQANGLSADNAGNLYMTGHTPPSGQNSYPDAFVSRFDASGNLIWKHTFGTEVRQESGVAAAADGLGGVFVAGDSGFLYDNGTRFSNLVFVKHFDAAGDLTWTYELDSTFNDLTSSLSADGHGALFWSGITGGSLGGPNQGGFDIFLAKFAVIPESSTLMLMASGLASLAPAVLWRHRRRPVQPP
jgi:hypothetical protein